MIQCEDLFGWLTSGGVDFFAGVPDSLLKDLCSYLHDHAKGRHVITANEGGAIALACGHYLATGNIPVVYMQNSGQGNAVNPLVSLASPEVYAIPMLLIIGWRGEPDTKDEPQHMKQGKVTLPLMETLEIPCRVLPDNDDEAQKCVGELIAEAKDRSMPVALVIRKGTFEKYKLQDKGSASTCTMTREAAVEKVAAALGESDVVVSTTGMLSRELYEYRDRTVAGHQRDFLTVGSMGHASQIAMGIALARPDRQVFCFDGDGAAIMHMGALAIIGAHAPKNYKHVIFNNAAHDSVGGMPTVGGCISFTDAARACCYTDAWRAETPEEVEARMADLMSATGPAMLEIMVCKGARADLGRPKTTPEQNKNAFMEFLSQ